MNLVSTIPPSHHWEEWNDHQIRDYARNKVANGSWSEEEAVVRAAAENENLLPDGFSTRGHHIRRIENKDTHESIGWIWVGLATEGPPDLAWLFDIEILPEHRGQGLGRQVMHLAEIEAQALGCTRLGLHVFATNKVACQLYESCGYKTTDISMVKMLG